MTYQQGLYGTYPGKRTEFSMMMSNIDSELQPLDQNNVNYTSTVIRKSSPSKEFYDLYDPYGTSTITKVPASQFASYTNKSEKCKKFMENTIRPCVAEFLTVLVSIIVYFHIESQLIQRHVTFFNKVIILSFVDGILYTVFFATFQTIHVSPIISIAQLFTLTTSWTLCILLIIMQITAVGIGSFLFHLFNKNSFWSPPAVIQDLTQDWSRGVYELVICQLIGTTIVILSNLLATKKCSHGKSSWRRLNRSPLCLSAAIGLSSLLSLFHSNISWNPLYNVVLLLLKGLNGRGYDINTNYAFFWIGPIVGSLLGSILFKLLFAPHDEKVTFINNDKNINNV